MKSQHLVQAIVEILDQQSYDEGLECLRRSENQSAKPFFGILPVTFATAVMLLMGLCACSVSQTLTPPTEGYAAVRFKQPVDVRDHAVNIYTFPTGSAFVADHQFPNGVDGPIYCGIALRNGVLFSVPTCFALQGDTTLILNAGCALPSALGCRVSREIPAGSFEKFRMTQ